MGAVRRGGRVARLARADGAVGQRAALGRIARMVARVEAWSHGSGLWLAEVEGRVAGALVVGSASRALGPGLRARALRGAAALLPGARGAGDRRGAARPRGRPRPRARRSRCCGWTAGPARLPWSRSTRSRASCATGASTCADGSVRSSHAPRPPARDGCWVALVLLAVAGGERGLLVAAHERVRDRDEDECVGEQHGAAEDGSRHWPRMVVVTARYIELRTRR